MRMAWRIEAGRILTKTVKLRRMVDIRKVPKLAFGDIGTLPNHN